MTLLHSLFFLTVVGLAGGEHGALPQNYYLLFETRYVRVVLNLFVTFFVEIGTIYLCIRLLKVKF